MLMEVYVGMGDYLHISKNIKMQKRKKKHQCALILTKLIQSTDYSEHSRLGIFCLVCWRIVVSRHQPLRVQVCYPVLYVRFLNFTQPFTQHFTQPNAAIYLRVLRDTG